MPPSHSGSEPTSVLFVCLGNICRSPLAEGVFLELVKQAGLEHRYVVDSAGTGAWHVGERPDPRSVEVAAAHGVTLPGTARQVTPGDLDRFDYVVAMDRENLAALKRMAATDAQAARIHLLRSFDPDADDDQVPDPYYGGPGGFEKVYRQVDAACRNLLEALEGRA